MLSLGRRCPLACSYCFADFASYRPQPKLEQIEANPDMLDSIDIIYPACDSDIFVYPDALDHLNRCTKLGKHISISTKCAPNETLLLGLKRISAGMRDNGLVLKISSSFSCWESAAMSEPRAAPVESRIKTICSLLQYGVSTSAIIKPIREDISFSEYRALIDRLNSLNLPILLGEEYRELQASSEISSTRRIDWLSSRPTWHVFGTKNYQAAVEYCQRVGADYYLSDLDLMSMLVERLRSLQSYTHAAALHSHL